ncbi:hypothetical protein DL93DRAFT_2089479 [Clavulina sp. PMI_390]|nr:hypothetical protein DL93DRAFT_2089479 [Clavulina sp. PMI_390]
MPEPQLWRPSATSSDGKPLPAPPLPPRRRPSHLADRPNPYDLFAPPSAMQMPAPSVSPIPDDRPANTYHPQSDPPPSLRPGYTPGPPAASVPYLNSPALLNPFPHYAPPNRGRLSEPGVLPTSSTSDPSTPGPSNDLVAPATPPRGRASSVPPSSPTTPSRTYDGAVQCSGVTKTGKRCTRAVKSPHPYTQATPAQDGDIERFCHQHLKDVLSSSGFYSRATPNKWVEFDDWIPDYLTADTKVALRTEMEKPASAADVPGYIYCYEIRDPRTPNEVHLKVGRAVNMVKRLDEWAKQCGSKEVVLRGWWPGKIIDDDGAGPSLLRGRVQAGDKGKFCHRLERLIHIELSDLVISEVYMTPEFLNPSKASTKASDSDDSSSSRTPAKKLVRKKCPDCGAMHKEIFSFARIPKGRLKGHEWDRVVQPVIERWGKFVEELV